MRDNCLKHLYTSYVHIHAYTQQTWHTPLPTDIGVSASNSLIKTTTSSDIQCRRRLSLQGFSHCGRFNVLDYNLEPLVPLR